VICNFEKDGNKKTKNGSATLVKCIDDKTYKLLTSSSIFEEEGFDITMALFFIQRISLEEYAAGFKIDVSSISKVGTIAVATATLVKNNKAFGDAAIVAVPTEDEAKNATVVGYPTAINNAGNMEKSCYSMYSESGEL
jgi:hypothetical protein